MSSKFNTYDFLAKQRKSPQMDTTRGFYGINTVYFVGNVVSLKDTLQSGRVQVRIEGLHGESIPNKELPMCQVLIPTTEGGFAGKGFNSSLSLGARVLGIFLNPATFDSPVVLGTLSGIAKGNTNALNQYKKNLPDNNENLDTYAEKSNKPKDSVPGHNRDTTKKNINLPGSSNLHKAYNFFKRKGNFDEYEDHAIYGILGNLMAESGFGTPADISPLASKGLKEGFKGFAKAGQVQKPKVERSFGIAQWYGSDFKGKIAPSQRLTNLINWCDTTKREVTSLEAQLQWIVLETKKDPATKKDGKHYLKNGGLHNFLKKSKNIEEATKIFLDVYESPFKNFGGSKYNPSVIPVKAGDDEIKKRERYLIERTTFARRIREVMTDVAVEIKKIDKTISSTTTV